MANLSGSQKIHRPVFGNMNPESWFPVYHLSYHFFIYPVHVILIDMHNNLVSFYVYSGWSHSNKKCESNSGEPREEPRSVA